MYHTLFLTASLFAALIQASPVTSSPGAVGPMILSRGTASLLDRGEIPMECRFGGDRTDFSYIQIFPGDGGTACFGWDAYFKCDKEWNDPDFSDIQTAVEKQIHADGWKAGPGRVGAWEPYFDLFTTAFSKPDAAGFVFVLAEVTSDPNSPGKGAKTYHYSRNGNFLSVNHPGPCP